MQKELALKVLDAILISSKQKIRIKTLENFFKDLDIEDLLKEAEKRYKDFGFFLYRDKNYVELVNKPEFSRYLINFFSINENELIQDFLEVLAIIAYAGPLTLKKIEKIRNKDSKLILEELKNEGFVEKKSNYYKVSDKFLKFFGFQKLEDLPDYHRLRKELTEEN